MKSDGVGGEGGKADRGCLYDVFVGMDLTRSA